MTTLSEPVALKVVLAASASNSQLGNIWIPEIRDTYITGQSAPAVDIPSNYNIGETEKNMSFESVHFLDLMNRQMQTILTTMDAKFNLYAAHRSVVEKAPNSSTNHDYSNQFAAQVQRPVEGCQMFVPSQAQPFLPAMPAFNPQHPPPTPMYFPQRQ